MKTIKKILLIILMILQLLQIGSIFSNVQATIQVGDTITLIADHKCNDLLQFYMPETDFWSYKEVWYVCYQDNEDNNKYPAFCIEPTKPGIGITYKSYDVSVHKERDNRIWRILNKGYMGSSWKEWNIESDDDFYYATKVALHSLIQEVSPKDKYRLGTRIIDGNSVEEIQRRGQKVLDIAQELYEYGINGTEIYEKPQIIIQKNADSKIEEINNISYYVQGYEIKGNRSLKSFDIEIKNFPQGTKILDSLNKELKKLVEVKGLFKIAIPTKEIKDDINGTINIKNALLKTNPVYLCQTFSKETQNYVTYMAGYEKAEALVELSLDSNKANLEILKLDKQTKQPLPNVTFKIEDINGKELAQVTTNKNGIATLNNIKPQIVKVKEIKVPEEYVLSKEEKQVELEWQKKISLIFENKRKTGQIEIYKMDNENKKYMLENVTFEVLDDNQNVVETLKTNKDGYAKTQDLLEGTYYIKEVETQKGYLLDEKIIKVEVKNEEIASVNITNELKKGQVRVIKMDKDDNEIKLEGVEFEILDENNNILETIKTDKNGEALSKKYSIKDFPKLKIREKETLEDYILSEEIKIIELKENKITSIKFENKKIPVIPEEPELPKLPRTGF